MPLTICLLLSTATTSLFYRSLVGRSGGPSPPTSFPLAPSWPAAGARPAIAPPASLSPPLQLRKTEVDEAISMHSFRYYVRSQRSVHGHLWLTLLHWAKREKEATISVQSLDPLANDG